ncbi:MAG: hypothetical protein LBN08_07050 [Lactobacillales bacterium]|nr:hypothetical protein [Lactobacillales bacterium]
MFEQMIEKGKEKIVQASEEAVNKIQDQHFNKVIKNDKTFDDDDSVDDLVNHLKKNNFRKNQTFLAKPIGKIAISLTGLLVIAFIAFCVVSNSYDAAGFNAFGVHKVTGKNIDEDGYYRDGFNNDGWNRDGIYKTTGTKYDENGFDISGYDKNGFDKDGYDKKGYDKNGFNKKGLNKWGWESDADMKAAKAEMGISENPTKSTYDNYLLDKEATEKGFSSSTAMIAAKVEMGVSDYPTKEEYDKFLLDKEAKDKGFASVQEMDEAKSAMGVDVNPTKKEYDDYVAEKAKQEAEAAAAAEKARQDAEAAAAAQKASAASAASKTVPNTGASSSAATSAPSGETNTTGIARWAVENGYNWQTRKGHCKRIAPGGSLPAGYHWEVGN